MDIRVLRRVLIERFFVQKLVPRAIIAVMSFVFNTETPRLIGLGIILAIIVLYRLGIIAYRLLFSPLAVFPGPKLAAASSIYEHFFNVVRNGKFVFEVERLHNIYGTYA